MTMKFDGIEDFVRHGRTLPRIARKAQRVALQTVAFAWKAEAKASMGSYQDGWPELADATKKHRVAKGFTENNPLLASGDLKESIHYRTSPTIARIGSANPHAAGMELGIPARNVPARPFLRPVAHRHSAKAANIIGAAVAYALASQANPNAPPPPPGGQEDES